MKKVVLLTIIGIIIITAPHAFAQTNERNRGFYIDAGVGFGGVVCSDLYEGVKPAITYELCIGWAVLQNLYVIVEGSATAHPYGVTISGLPLSSKPKAEKVGFWSYFIGPGLRLYPLPSEKHLQLGASFGWGYAEVKYPSSITYKSDLQLGFKLSAAYDFDSTMTGWALLLGGETMFTFISASPVIGFTVFAKVVFK